MNPVRILVAGASGRMGRQITKLVLEADTMTLSGALDRAGHPDLGRDVGELLGVGRVGVALSDDPLALLMQADAIVDFTSPEHTVELCALAAQARIVHVIGTTGLGAGHKAKIQAAARHAVIIQSGNMSLGVNLLAALVEQAARALGESFDIEIVEMHHRAKVDAPSGTALMLGEAAARGRNIDLENNSVRARDGITGARPEGAIGFSALRGGTVVGDHTVMFAGAHERIELSHKAEDRGIFARGALQAALWGQGKKPGLYSMKDVLNLGD